MTSIVTNRSAIGALDTLRKIDHDLNKTQTRVSSGYRVDKSADNAAYWSIAKTMSSDNSAMGAVEDALGLGAAQIDITYMGMSNAIDVMSEFKAKLVAAREPGVDRNKVNAELVELRAEMRTIADGSSFNGENWLVTDLGAATLDKSIVTSFNRAQNGMVSVGTVQYGQTNGSLGELNRLIDDSADGMYGILTQPGAASGWDVNSPNYVFMFGNNPAASTRQMGLDATTTNDEIDTMIDGVEYMLGQMTSVAARLGSIGNQIQGQTSFVADLRDANKRGVGQLRDANISTEATRIKALQVKQQIGLQSLSIANSNATNILSLYQ